jgi:NitT/TauT family transport system substrate-binding protein
MKTSLRALSLIVAGIISIGVPCTGGLVTSAHGKGLVPVTLRLAFIYNGHRSPYLLGVDKGFYAEEGLQVEVLEGKGVTSSMQTVASKQDTFTIVDPPSLMLGAAQGMPLRTVTQLYQVSPNAVISWKDAKISKPGDLVGKTVASQAGDTTTTMFYALLAKNGIERSSVSIATSDGGTRNQTFLGKRAQAMTGFTNDSYLGMKDATKGEVNVFAYSEFGINTMGDGLAAHTDTITKTPDVVRGFVRASIRAYKYAMEHPEESIASLAKRSPNANKEVELQKLRTTFGLLDANAKDGIGYSTKAKWESTQVLMLEYGGLTKKVDDVTVFYTNEFLPKN